MPLTLVAGDRHTERELRQPNAARQRRLVAGKATAPERGGRKPDAWAVAAGSAGRDARPDHRGQCGLVSDFAAVRRNPVVPCGTDGHDSATPVVTTARRGDTCRRSAPGHGRPRWHRFSRSANGSVEARRSRRILTTSLVPARRRKRARTVRRVLRYQAGGGGGRLRCRHPSEGRSHSGGGSIDVGRLPRSRNVEGFDGAARDRVRRGFRRFVKVFHRNDRTIQERDHALRSPRQGRRRKLPQGLDRHRVGRVSHLNTCRRQRRIDLDGGHRSARFGPPVDDQRVRPGGDISHDPCHGCGRENTAHHDERTSQKTADAHGVDRPAYRVRHSVQIPLLGKSSRSRHSRADTRERIIITSRGDLLPPLAKKPAAGTAHALPQSPISNPTSDNSMSIVPATRSILVTLLHSIQ
ncbi:hypothetical protein SAMN04489731_1145 [Amycolatopsis regifaucium]|nr:hypothetical protein SAMN04489731_1145 [Amycolatopsis regifaucium]